MIKNKKVIAIIPARAGSKSIPNKNLIEIAGKPLLAWAILAAKGSKYIDEVVVSTNGADIAAVAQSYGARPVKRPEDLATDTSLVIDTIKNVLSTNDEYEYAVLLEPTSPLRLSSDIDECLEKLTENYDSVATFTEAELNPHRAWKLVEGQAEIFIDGAIPWLPRQKLPNAIQLNGAVYCFDAKKIAEQKAAVFFGKAGVVMIPAERAVDIDNHIHMKIAEYLLKERECKA